MAILLTIAALGLPSFASGQDHGSLLPVQTRYLAPGDSTPSDAPYARLAGDGHGNITDVPAFLLPPVKVEINGEYRNCLAAGFPLVLLCNGMSPQGVRGGRRHFVLTDTTGGTAAESDDYVEARSSGKHGKDHVSFVPGDGCVVRCEFEDKRTGTFHTQFDPGPYDGAGVRFLSGTFDYSRSESPFMGNSTWHGLATGGRFLIRWQQNDDSLSVRVVDQTRGIELPYSPYLDESCWGFVPVGTSAMQINRDLGVSWGGPKNVKTPRGQRKIFLLNKLPASNTSEFTLYVNGQHWNFWREDGIRMPTDGQSMLLTTAFGEWNTDRSEFTQFPGPVHMGEKWLLSLGEEQEQINDILPGEVAGIMLEDGAPMSCVTVHLNGENTDEIRATRPDGLYRFAGLRDGHYTVVPFKTGFTFEPSYREVAVRGGRVEAQPFAASPMVDTAIVGDTVRVAGVPMVRAPTGRFRIGQRGVATPLHQVTLDGFLVGSREITRGLYNSVMGKAPANITDDSTGQPVEGVSWYDAAGFCNRLSELAGRKACYDTASWSCDYTANGFRLPTEAEWEYACRAGSYTNFFPGCDESDLIRAGWYGGSDGTKPVAGKNPNSWGLFDTHGNVAEWCNDWYADYFPNQQHNPAGPSEGEYRVVRGGSFSSEAFNCRSAFRDGLEPEKANNTTGFRVVCREH